MRRFPILVTALGAALAAVLGLPLAAHAGGPTSVLVTSPGQAATALYYTDSAYADLEQLVTQKVENVAVPSSPEQGLQGYNLTWLIHDQYIWRTDRVYLDGSEVLVETTMVEAGADPAANGTTAWHRVTGPAGKQLVDLLRGLLRGDQEPRSEVPSELPDLTASTATAPPASAPPAEPAWFALTGWVWVLPGLALGVVAGVLAGRSRRWSPVKPEPRQVLLDREPRRA